MGTETKKDKPVDRQKVLDLIQSYNERNLRLLQVLSDLLEKPTPGISIASTQTSLSDGRQFIDDLADLLD